MCFTIKFFFCLDTYNTDTIAISKSCKLNFTALYHVQYLVMSLQRCYQGFFSMNMVCSYYFEALVLTFRMSYIKG